MSTNLKSAAISELRRWKGAQLLDFEKRETEVEAQLRAAVPESFRNWLEGVGGVVITALIQEGVFGPCTFNAYSGEFKQFSHELQLAWEGIVDIQIEWDRPVYGDSYRATFTAL